MHISFAAAFLRSAAGHSSSSLPNAHIAGISTCETIGYSSRHIHWKAFLFEDHRVHLACNHQSILPRARLIRAESATRPNGDADHQHPRPDLCHDSNDCLGAIYCNARNHLRIAITVGYHSSSAGWHLRSDNACGGNNRIAKCVACEVGYRLDLSCHYQFALCALVLWGTHKADLSALKVSLLCTNGRLDVLRWRIARLIER
jgi:hypothetical protein